MGHLFRKRACGVHWWRYQNYVMLLSPWVANTSEWVHIILRSAGSEHIHSDIFYSSEIESQLE